MVDRRKVFPGHHEHDEQTMRLRQAVGPHQFAVARPAGLDAMARSVCQRLRRRPQDGVMLFDANQAFTDLDRNVAADVLQQRAPWLATPAFGWLARPSVSEMRRDDGSVNLFDPRSGSEQGVA